MSDDVFDHDYDKDALHILPLAIVPLATAGLREARLIKNSRLEGVVELFANESSGSGQVAPGELEKIFELDEDCEDLRVIESLAALPSYDVYSLRIQLRERGIRVDNVDSLKLSDGKAQELADYMRVFIAPLVQTVYGDSERKVETLGDIVNLFADPDVDVARRNLQKMAEKLEVDLLSIPRFLENYGDVYLSLAYYQNCLDDVMPIVERLTANLIELKQNPNFRDNYAFKQICTTTEDRLRDVTADIGGLLERFRTRTKDMWDEISHARFREMEELITSYHTRIGGSLCAITVKMNAWHTAFPRNDGGQPMKRKDFIMAEIWPGIETVERLVSKRAA